MWPYPTPWFPMMAGVPPSEPSGPIKFVLYPLAVLIITAVFRTAWSARVALRNNVRRLEMAIEEIEKMRSSYSKYSAIFHAAYSSGAPSSLFALRIAADPKYYPYVVASNSAISVFGKDPTTTQNFLFLREKALTALSAYHDECYLLNELLSDVREDAFINLPADRKLAALGAIAGQYEAVDRAYLPCLVKLRKEHRRITSRSVAWNLFFLREAKFAGMRELGVWLRKRWRRWPCVGSPDEGPTKE